MKKLPVIEARVFCPRQGREIDCERCYVCTWLAGVSAKDGSITCSDPRPARAWADAALASLAGA